MIKDIFPSIPQIKGLFKYLVLYVLKDNELHGYGIMQKISELVGFGYTPSPGVIYPTLQLLEDMDYVYSEKKGRKTVYYITNKGISILNDKISEIEDFLTRVKRIRRVFDEVGGDEIYMAVREIIKNYPFIDKSVKDEIREEARRFRLNIDRILRGEKYGR